VVPARPPRVAAVHDLSGFGRCSLSVILPVMSVMGVQVCPIPTAVLSTHTGGFGDVCIRDLTDYIEPCISHYRRVAMELECIYTGYLSSPNQVAHCLEFFDAWPRALVVVDPVMGDNGKLYRSFTREMVAGMERMVRKAQVITPNLTEAAILLGQDPPTDRVLTASARSMLARLGEMGPGMVVITGVPLATGEYANICYDRERNSYWKSTGDYIPVHYPGTGDIFAAVLTASLLQGDSLPIATDRAARYVELTIKTTYSYSSEPREGVMLERTLEWLTRGEVGQRFQSL